MTKWDVARELLECHRCEAPIAEGEQFRGMGPLHRPTCIACAKTATGEDPPADMPMRPKLPELKKPERWYEPDPIVDGPVIPEVASTAQRGRIWRARKRLEDKGVVPRVERDWWND